jgi:hypothetical protein
MTFQLVAIDCRTEFGEYRQLHMTLSRVKNPGDLWILFPDDMDDFTIRQPVDQDAIQILETMQSSGSLPIPRILPDNNVESGIASIEPSGASLSDELSCLDVPDDPIRCVPNLDHDAFEIFDLYLAEILLDVQIMSWILKD